MKIPEKYRDRSWHRKLGVAIEPDSGFFSIPFNNNGKPVTLRVMAGFGLGWEHVSVSLPKTTPTWNMMCFVKSLFWNDEEAVMQLHPPKSQYVNNHPFCLHLWRPTEANIPLPDAIMVGIKGLEGR